MRWNKRTSGSPDNLHPSEELLKQRKEEGGGGKKKEKNSIDSN
jgi:hypothetical protein